MAESNTNPATEPQANSQTSGNPTEQQMPEIDYEKLAGVVTGRQRAAGETALKNYLKQQGLSQEQMTQAISTYKQQQETTVQQHNQQFEALQQENQRLKAQILQSQLNAEAMTQAAVLNVEPDTIPYLIRLADLSGAVDDKGAISKDAVTAALNQVLDDIPALKKQTGQSRGFVPIGGDGADRQTAEQEDRMRKYFGLSSKK